LIYSSHSFFENLKRAKQRVGLAAWNARFAAFFNRQTVGQLLAASTRCNDRFWPRLCKNARKHFEFNDDGAPDLGRFMPTFIAT
jgi:hypothetical protein